MTQYKYLYIYPHPDDESFGPAGAMHYQARQGHEVHLLTLTRGGATKERHKFDYSIDEMGAVRYEEMQRVAKVLKLASLKVLDLPDGKLKEFNPLKFESVVRKHIENIQPNIIVTYPIHGISGFHDHLATHPIVKRVFCAMRDEGVTYLKRLCYSTLPITPDLKEFHFSLSGSTPEEIDCIVTVEDEDLEAHIAALRCYESYQDVIEKVKIVDKITNIHYFEICTEKFDPPLMDLTHSLQED